MENKLGLKICPFCGGEAKKNIAKAETGELQYYISCTKCYVRTRSFPKNEEAAAKAWNRRHENQTYKTYKEYFEENIPQDAFPHIDRSSICRRSVFGYRLTDGEILCEVGKGDCEECWNEVMKNE